MQRFKDIHANKRFWLLASGPSLSDIDTTRIPDTDIIIACNSAVLKSDRINYACFTDGGVMGFDYYHDLKNRDCKVIVFNEKEIPAIKEETYFIKKRKDRNDWSFSKQDTEVIFGIDIIHCAIHLAFIMGAIELILCGVDLQVTDGNYHWHDRENITLKTNESLMPTWYDVDKRYGFGAEHNGFTYIQKANKGFKIINISQISKLECFPIKTFNDVLAK